MKDPHQAYMKRCLQLALLGAGKVAPNPLVGAVIVCKGRIIGEGYHKKYGAHHAEVNAINSVKDKTLLSKSTLYVNLEPCNHTGKTPPCADLILKYKIPNVVIGMIDPNHLVNGSGIKKLEESGVKVISGICQRACEWVNRRFISLHKEGRPYIILKWAETSDGFIGRHGKNRIPWLSSSVSRKLVHKWRTEEASILVGATTAVQDNPKLNARDWKGNDPLRIVIDQNNRVPAGHHLLDGSIPTLKIGSRSSKRNSNRVKSIFPDRKNLIKELIAYLNETQIQSLIVEGGAHTIQSFIDQDLWDEARVFISKGRLDDGLAAPEVIGQMVIHERCGSDNLHIYIR